MLCTMPRDRVVTTRIGTFACRTFLATPKQAIEPCDYKIVDLLSGQFQRLRVSKQTEIMKKQHAYLC